MQRLASIGAIIFLVWNEFRLITKRIVIFGDGILIFYEIDFAHGSNR